MRDLVLIAHNVRSVHNVGSLLRTADGLGVTAVWLTGFTPYPAKQGDRRLPHEAKRLTQQLHKTALGAESTINWHQNDSIEDVAGKLKQAGYTLAALEQTQDAIKLSAYNPPTKLALVLGHEVAGLEPEIIELCDIVLQIPVLGKKESFNVAQAAAMALYHMRYN